MEGVHRIGEIALSDSFLSPLQEIETLVHLEETTLSSDLSQGFALKSLTGVKICIIIA